MLANVTAVFIDINVQLDASRVVWADERFQNLVGIAVGAGRRKAKTPIDG